MANTRLLTFLSQLNQAFLHKHTRVTCHYSRNTLLFINLLQRNRLIYGYTISNLNITVYLIVVNNLSLLTRLFIYSTKKEFLTFSCSDIKRFSKQRGTYFRPVYVFATNIGYVTHYEIIKHRIGGKLLAILY